MPEHTAPLIVSTKLASPQTMPTLPPMNGDWVTDDAASRAFKLYFSEDMQLGTGSITITQTTSTKAATIASYASSNAALAMTGVSESALSLAATAISGANHMPYSRPVELKIGKATYKDTYGNVLPATFFGSNYATKYVVKVSTSFLTPW